ncbi:MAG: hypothetical protein FWE80_06485 [Oscillospiraceae bacterium]|nr:hypothetical protein [Oscillospiraceae bacterium]
MQALIFADADPRLLRPITNDVPPAMLKLCGKPLIVRQLDWLASGICDSADGAADVHIKTGYRSHIIADWLQQQPHPLNPELSDQAAPPESPKNSPLSTLNSPLICLSGDTLPEGDIDALTAAHRRNKAVLTVCAASRHGLETDHANRLLAIRDPEVLLESGCWLVTAREGGVPAGMTLEIIEEFLTAGGVYIHETGQFKRITEPAGYLAAIRRVLERQSQEPLPEANFEIVHPVFIGEHVEIGAGAVIGPFTAIEDGGFIGCGANITGSVLLESVRIGEHAHIKDAAICHGASVRADTVLYENAVIGAGAVVGEKAVVSAGMRIWPDRTVPDGARINENIRYGGRRETVFEEIGGELAIGGEMGVELTPEFAARLGAAMGSAAVELYKRRDIKIAVGYIRYNPASVLALALSAGLLSTGCTVWDFGDCIPPQFDYLAGESAAVFGVMIGDGTVRLAAGGDRLHTGLHREVELRLRSGDVVRSGWNRMSGPVEMHGLRRTYTAALTALAGPLERSKADVRGAGEDSRLLLSMALAGAGCKTGEGMRLHLGPGGRRLSIFTEETGFLWPEQVMALNALIDLRQGLDLDVTDDAPQAIEKMAAQYGRAVRRHPPEQLPAGVYWARDGLMMAARILRYLAEQSLPGQSQMTPAVLAAALPPFAVSERNIFFSGDADETIRRLCEGLTAENTGGGVRISGEDGIILIHRPRSGQILRIRAEAERAEIAEEIGARAAKAATSQSGLVR